MKTTFIYFLKDPENPNKGYVGKTGNPKSRLSSHLAPNPGDCPRTRWINSFRTRDIKPILEILDEVPREEGSAWEIAYVEFFRDAGYDLLNATAGGDGCLDPIPETRAKLRESRMGEKNHFFGKQHTAESKAAISAKKAGVFYSQEVRTKNSAGHRGKKSKHNKSGFVGVSWDQSRNRWFASINIDPPKTHHLGRFKKLEDAVFVRALAMDKYFSV